jgi:hypothetical protein
MARKEKSKQVTRKKTRVSWTENKMEESPHKRLAELGALPPSEEDGVVRDVEVMSEAPEIDTTVAHNRPKCHESRFMRRLLVQCMLGFAVLLFGGLIIAASFIADDPTVLCGAAKTVLDVTNLTEPWDALKCSLAHNESGEPDL